MKKPLIFVISGKAQAGKDTTGDIIKEHLESKGLKIAKIAYAKYIKGYAIDYFGWDGKEENKPRDLFQMLGTEIRTTFNKPNFFVDRMKEDIEILSNFFDGFVLSDARLVNEIEMPKKNFENVYAIRIIRDIDNGLNVEQKKNLTETGLDNFSDYDYVIYNDGTIEELKKKVINIVDSIMEE